MDPATITKIVTISIGTAISIAETSKKIYDFINKAKHVNDTLRTIQAEVKQVSTICTLIQEQITQLGASHDSFSHGQLLETISTELSECKKPIEGIEKRICSKDGGASVWRRLLTQGSLEMDMGDINQDRARITRSQSNLQLALTLTVLQVRHIGTQQADLNHLFPLLTKICKMLEQQNISHQLRECAKPYVSAGQSMYEETIRSTSILEPQISGSSSTVLGWLSQVHTLKTDREDRDTGHSLLEEPISSNSQQAEADEDSDDDFNDDIDVTDNCSSRAKAAFLAQDYARASSSFLQTLNCIQALPRNLRLKYNLEAIQLSLAICSFHLHDLDIAEEALRKVGRPSQTSEDINLALEAEECLVVIYIRLKNFDLATRTCAGLLRAQKKARNGDACRYRILALMARCHDLQNNSDLADSYRDKIPYDGREKVCQHVATLIEGSSKSDSVDAPPDYEAAISAKDRGEFVLDTYVLNTNEKTSSPPVFSPANDIPSTNSISQSSSATAFTASCCSKTSSQATTAASSISMSPPSSSIRPSSYSATLQEPDCPDTAADRASISNSSQTASSNTMHQPRPPALPPRIQIDGNRNSTMLSPDINVPSYPDGVSCVGWSSDSSLFAVATNYPWCIELLRIPRGELFMSLTSSHQNTVSCIAFNRENTILVAAMIKEEPYQDIDLQLWSISTGQIIGTVTVVPKSLIWINKLIFDQLGYQLFCHYKIRGSVTSCYAILDVQAMISGNQRHAPFPVSSTHIQMSHEFVEALWVGDCLAVGASSMIRYRTRYNPWPSYHSPQHDKVDSYHHFPDELKCVTVNPNGYLTVLLQDGRIISCADGTIQQHLLSALPIEGGTIRYAFLAYNSEHLLIALIDIVSQGIFIGAPDLNQWSLLTASATKDLALLGISADARYVWFPVHNLEKGYTIKTLSVSRCLGR